MIVITSKNQCSNSICENYFSIALWSNGLAKNLPKECIYLLKKRDIYILDRKIENECRIMKERKFVH